MTLMNNAEHYHSGIRIIISICKLNPSSENGKQLLVSLLQGTR